MSGTTIAANTGFFSGNIDLVTSATDLQSALSSATSDLASVLAAETDTATAAATVAGLVATLTAAASTSGAQAAASALTAAGSAAGAAATAAGISASAASIATAAATAAVLAGGALPLTGGTLTGGLTGTTGTFSGAVIGPTAAVDTSSTALATTAYVVGQAASALPLMDSTAAQGTSTRFARADHVHPVDTSRYAASNPSGFQTAAQVTAALPVASSITPLGDGTAAVGTGTTWARADHVHPTDVSRAPLASPTFTGTVTIPTGASISGFAPLASPTFTGTVTIPTGASISGFAALTGAAFTGGLSVGTNTTAQILQLNGPAGGSRTIQWGTANSKRWVLTANATAEAGSNAGSDMVISAFDDTGTLLTSPLTITRSTGTSTFATPVVLNSSQALSHASGITAHAGGTQALATALTATINRIGTCATAGDSVSLPATTQAGLQITVVNSGAASCQVYGAGTDTINGVATATGVPLASGKVAIYSCPVSGAWFGGTLT